jgi:hypothetical protein
LGELGLFGRGWKGFFGRIFERQVQRRGTHVNTAEIGSRDGGLCFGGILGNHADLRRDLFWGNLKLAFFWVLLGVPRRGSEEGGHLCVSFRCLGEFICVN